MGYYAALKCGSRVLNLNESPFGLDPSFVPPGGAVSPVIAQGWGLSGGSVVDRDYPDRAFNLPLQISGSTVPETHGAVDRLDTFIEMALNYWTDDLYFVYGPSDAVPYDPQWGQRFFYYEIKERPGSGLMGDYGLGGTRMTRLLVNLGLIISPVATGQRQRMGSATGGILEHAWAASGLSRGLVIPQATENQMTNPIFGHSTWNTGWSTGGSLVAAKNTNKEFVLFGEASARISRNASGVYIFSQSIDANTNGVLHVLSGYVKKPDSSAVTSSDVALLYNGSVQTTSYWYVGDGWYRMTALFFSVIGFTTVGIAIQSVGVTVYLDGMQLEESGFVTPLCHGDMLDCSWASTAHNSETTRTAARYRLDDAEINHTEATFRIVWMPEVNSARLTGATYRLMYSTTSQMRLTYDKTNTRWAFNDGTTSITSASGKSFLPGDILVFHATMGPDGIELYVNGVSVASNTTYTIPSAIGDVYLGSSHIVTEHTNGTYLDFTIDDHALSSTEVLNDYNDIYQHLHGGDGCGQRLNAIPWIWTDDGDGTLDNCYDSTHENFAFIGGVPGNLRADTDWLMEASGGQDNIAFSLQNYEYLRSILNILEIYSDQQGTATSSADSGSQVYTFTYVGASDDYVGPIYGSDPPHVYYPENFGKNYYLITRLEDDGSNLTAGIAVFNYGNFLLYQSEYEAIDPDSASRGIVLIGPVGLEIDTLKDAIDVQDTIITLALKRTTGSADVLIDYIIAVPEPFLFITDDPSDFFVIRGKKAYKVVSDTNRRYEDKLATRGNSLDLYPNQLNHFMHYSDIVNSGTLVTFALTLTDVGVTPRWLCL